MRSPFGYISLLIVIAGLGLIALGVFTASILLPARTLSSVQTPSLATPTTLAVWPNSSPTLVPAPTTNPTPAATQPAPTSAATVTPSRLCDAAEFIRDVTVPDGSVMQIGEEFSKTWRLKNAGSCTWEANFQLVFIKGTQMTDETTISFPTRIFSGDMIDLTVAMTAPDRPGSYTGYWLLRNSEGDFFGIGREATGMFWVNVNVTENGEPEPGSSNNEAMVAAEAGRDFLAGQLGIRPVQLVILEVSSGRWFDSCLGIDLGSSYDCRPVPEGIPGYSILLRSDDGNYEVHTTLKASYIFWKTAS